MLFAFYFSFPPTDIWARQFVEHGSAADGSGLAALSVLSLVSAG
jgi:hypothetical protein